MWIFFDAADFEQKNVTLTEAKQTRARDGRLHLVLVIAFLYLSWELVSPWLPSFSGSSVVKSAHLSSISPGQLVVEYKKMIDSKGSSSVVPARHAPFFFQSIPINSADKELLMTVKGIGPALAESLIYHREHFGPFKRVDDLTKIQGVGTKRAASIAPFLLFDEVP